MFYSKNCYVYIVKIIKHIVFGVMNTIFHIDLVLINLNDKIIRYIFQAKNQMFLFFNYLHLN